MTDTNLDRAAKMARNMPVTQEDREDAAKVAVLVEMRELILAGKADHHAEPWAAHRITADLAGYERGQRETVARIVAWLRQPRTLIRGISMAQNERLSDAIEAGEWK